MARLLALLVVVCALLAVGCSRAEEPVPAGKGGGMPTLPDKPQGNPEL